MSSGGHGNTYSTPVPAGFAHTTFGDCQTWFGRMHGATVLAVRDSDGLVVSPSWDRPVSAGTTLYYVAAERIDAKQLIAGR
jgi:voltage-gated potassium channel